MWKWIIGGIVVLALIGAATGSGESTDTSKSDTSKNNEAPEAAPKATKRIKVPDVVGMNHQAAQDKLQDAGLFMLNEKDCTGQGRMLLLDRNWKVKKQTPAAGRKVGENRTITLCSVKQTDGASEPAPAPAESPAPAEPAEPELTSGQENALESGQSYIDSMAFSYNGLIQQLSSSAGEGFSKADATYAADHVDVDWNAEAVESAQGYLDTMSFSRQSLIEQLSSSAGEGFTLEQAQYAVDQVY